MNLRWLHILVLVVAIVSGCGVIDVGNPDSEDPGTGAAYDPKDLVFQTTESSICKNQNTSPTAKIRYTTPTVGTTNQSFSLDATDSSDSESNIVRYHWEFGDGNQADGAQVTHTYSLPGSYTVILGVTDSCGLTNQIQFQVVIH